MMSHVDSLKMQFTMGDFTTRWQTLKKGIMVGCTISVALSFAAMNVLLKAGGTQCRGPKADDGTRHPACRAFMDDITMMNPLIQGTLSSLERMTTWAWMQFKPRKSRSLCILKGMLLESIFIIQGSEIPTVQEQGI